MDQNHIYQQQQQGARRTSYSELSTQSTRSSQSGQSAPTSPTFPAFASSSSASTTSTMNAAARRQLPAMIQTQQQPGGVAAPLPSPSSLQPDSYFASFQPPTSHPSQQQQQRQIPQDQSAREQYIGQRGGSGGVPETTSFLKDFNLVAEAAKRAQMACLTRDFGDVGL